MNDRLFGIELLIRLILCVLRGRLSICVCASVPFGFEGEMFALIVLVPDYCLSFFFMMMMIIGIIF